MTTWPRVTLGDLCEIQIGRTPARAEARYWGPGHKWLSIADMAQGRDIVATTETITDAAVRECGCKVVRAGTLVFSFKLSIGKVGFVRTDMYTNEAIAALTIRNAQRADPLYLYRALQALDLSGVGERAVKGLTLNTRSVSELPVPLPPLSDQRWIAATLDKADAILHKQHESLPQLDAFLRSAFFAMFGDSLTNSMRWDTARLQDVCTRITVGHVGPMTTEYRAAGIPFLRSLNVRRSLVDQTDLKFVSPAFHSKLSKSLLRPFDVVSVRTGKPGVSAVIPASLGEANCADLIVLSCGARLRPDYLCEVLNQRLGDRETIQGSTGAVQTHFNIGRARDMVVPVPPLDIQERFACIVDAAMLLRSKLDRAQATAEELFLALQWELFRSGSLASRRWEGRCEEAP